MPEGDSLASLARTLTPLVGSTVLACDLRWPSIAAADLTGCRLEDVRAAGKYLIMDFGPRLLVTHLRMEGRWEMSAAPPPFRPPRGHRVRAVLLLALPADGAQVQLVGTQLGEMRLVGPSGLDGVIGHLGPDPLNTRVPFDEQRAARLLTSFAGDASDGSIGAALLDQRRIAGVGNVIRSEVLFLAKISPFASIESVAAAPGAAELLVGLSRDVLRMNVGRRRRTTPLGWQSGLWVYGREGKGCLACGTTVLRGQLASLGSAQGQAERVVYWCPACQPSGTPPGQAS